MEQVWSVTRAQDDPDLALVRAMATGDAAALDMLYQRHGSSLLAYLVGQLGERQRAEDVLQEVMLAAWRSAPRFRSESTVRTWLLAIARHRALNDRQRRPPPTEPLPPDLRSHERSPLRVAEQAGQRDALQRTLHQLPEAQRETLELVFFHGLSGPEAARVQGVALGTIKSRLHRAKAALRQVLGQENDDA